MTIIKAGKNRIICEVNGFQAVDKLVKPRGNSGGVYLPKEWIGKRVKIILIEDEH